MKISLVKSIAVVFLIAVLGALASVSVTARQAEDPGVLLRSAIEKEEVDGNLQGAIDLYKQIVAKFGDSRAIAAKAQLHIGLCYEKLGLEEAQKAFQKVVDNYPEQSEAVREAREKLALLPRSRALMKTGVAEFSLRQVWAESGVDTEGSISPDGRFLSFVDWETGDLAIRELATGSNRRLTNKGTWEQSPEFAMFSKWSRDGRRLAYQWYCKDDILELRVLDLKDSSIRTIHRNKSLYDWAQAFDWSPDGRHVLAAIFLEATPTQGRETRAGLISVEDGSVEMIEGHFKTLLASSSLPQGFAFSPDGRFIVYDAPRTDEETGNRDIFLIALHSGTESLLVDHPENDEVVAWTPDGRGLLFTSDRTGSQDLYLLPLSDGRPREGPQLIKSGVGIITPLGFTPRGDLYYGLGASETDVYIVEVDPDTGKVRGPAKKLALPYQGQNQGPNYSPDGKLIVYLSTPRGRGRIVSIYSQDTGRVRELHLRLPGIIFPSWIPPDGRRLSILGSDKEGRRVVYKVDIQTGEATTIDPHVDRSLTLRAAPVWAKDGKSFFYTAGLRSDEKRYIYTYDLETGKNERLPGSPDDACFIAISLDGKWLAFVNEQGKKVLRIMPASGGEPREIHSFEQNDHLMSPAWSADGRYIYLPKLRDPKGNIWDLDRISLDGKDVERTDLGLLWVRFLSVSPDGRSIAFQSPGTGPTQAEVWVMENFLPVDKVKK